MVARLIVDDTGILTVEEIGNAIDAPRDEVVGKLTAAPNVDVDINETLTVEVMGHETAAPNEDVVGIETPTVPVAPMLIDEVTGIFTVELTGIAAPNVLVDKNVIGNVEVKDLPQYSEIVPVISLTSPIVIAVPPKVIVPEILNVEVTGKLTVEETGILTVEVIA